MVGFEPTTFRLRIECTTTVLHRRKTLISIAELLAVLSNNFEIYGSNVARSQHQVVAPPGLSYV